MCVYPSADLEEGPGCVASIWIFGVGGVTPILEWEKTCAKMIGMFDRWRPVAHDLLVGPDPPQGGYHRTHTLFVYRKNCSLEIKKCFVFAVKPDVTPWKTWGTQWNFRATSFGKCGKIYGKTYENLSYGMILMEYWWIIWMSLQPINTWGSFVVGSNPTAAENWKTNRTIWEWRMMWATSMKSLETTQHSSGLSLETTQYKQHITS